MEKFGFDMSDPGIRYAIYCHCFKRSKGDTNNYMLATIDAGILYNTTKKTTTKKYKLQIKNS